ncbi:MAG: ADP-ribosylglycohydrolase family protein, partial [Candidatus Neomarinimicrobiota bacterium]|nr:ADP-ribosylglycohydrolase family protein [Candidatus Neomarinimicrobiota bacterium]
MKQFIVAVTTFTMFYELSARGNTLTNNNKIFDSELHYSLYVPDGTERIIPRTVYLDQLQGFWLAQCIANWTGLITEMDKIEAPFYTDENWGDPDQKNIWGN